MRKSIQFLILALCFVLAGTNLWAQVIEVENVIDVTDTYITNASFETGDMTGWTEKCYNGEAETDRPVGNETGYSSVRNIGDDLSSSDGVKMYEMFAWKNVTWNSFYEIHQALPSTLPAGTYTLTCVVSTMGAAKKMSLFAGTDQTFGLTYDMYATNDEYITTGDTGDADYRKGHLLSITFTWNGYDGSHPLYVGAGIVVNQWSWVIALKLDNFRLYQHKTVTSTNYLSNPSYDQNGAVVNAANNPSISNWTCTRPDGSNTGNTYFAIINTTSNGGTYGSRMDGNGGKATPLHGNYCALIRRGSQQAEANFLGDATTDRNVYSNGSGLLTATASGLQPGTYNCKLYYKLVHVGDGTPYVELKVTPQTGRGTESSAQGGGSINTGLTDRNSTDFRLNGNWDDFGWNELSTTFTITGTGTATASVAVKMMAQNTSGAWGDRYFISGYYAWDTEALIDHITFTKIASPIDLSTGDYYFENQETGQWLSAGETWGTHLTSDNAGIPITLSQGTYPGFYDLGTPFTDGDGSGYINDRFYSDGTADNYQFQESTANPGEYYIITPGGQLLTTTGTSTDYVEAEVNSRNINTTVTTNPPTSTRWKMYTRAQRIASLKALTADPSHPDDPVAGNATFLIENANYDRNRDHSKWTNWAQTGFGGEARNMDIEHFNKTFDFYQTLSDLPRGHYALRVQGYYRPGSNTNISSAENALLYANPGTEETVVLPLIASEGREYSLDAFDTQNTQSGTTVYVPNNQANASKAFTGTYYDQAILTFSTTADNQSTKVGVKKTTTIDQDWTVIDNFRLYYSPLSEEEALEEALKDVTIPEGQMNHIVYHEAEEAFQDYEVVKERDALGNLTHTKDQILAAYDAVSVKIAAAKASIDEYIIINKYLTALQGSSQLGAVNPAAIASDATITKYSDGAYYPTGHPGTTGTYEAHGEVVPLYKQFVRNYWNENVLEENTDLTSYIVNQGFEFEDTDEWTHGNADDVGVRRNENQYSTTGTEGNWLFNIWWQGSPLTQTITDLPNGKYELQAKLTNAAITEGHSANLYLRANDTHNTMPFPPPTPTSRTVVVYQLTSTLTAGDEYLIVNRNSAGSGYALGHSGTTIARDAVTVNAADDLSTAPYINVSDVDATSVWTVGSGYTFKNGDYYIRYNSGLSISTTSTNWTWNGTNNYLYYYFNGSNSYYIRYYNNNFTAARNSNTSIYLYKKVTLTITEDIVSYTNNEFVQCALEFEVTDGTATIGASAGNNDGSYNETGGWWYKADNFRLILKELYVTPETYYLYNESTGQYLSTHGGANYGTQAMLDDVGLDMALAADRHFETRVFPNGTVAHDNVGNQSLYVSGDGVYLDGPTSNVWKFAKCGETYYLKQGTKYIASNGINAVVVLADSKTDAAKWQLKTRAQRIQELEDMESGDEAVDATFLLPGNDFTRGDRRVFDSWTAVNNAGNAGFGVYSADANGFADETFTDGHTNMYYEVNGSPRFRRGGRNNNFVFEAWHNPFDMYQELTGLPNGVYTLSGQCFDGENGERTQFYSESTIHLDLTPMSVALVKDIMIDWKQDFPQNTSSGLAGNGFTSGRISDAMSNGTIARSSGMKIKVVNGTMKVGFRCGWDQWTVADNLRLTYRPFVEADVQEEIDPAQSWLDNMVNVDRVSPYDDDPFKIPNDEIHRFVLQMAVNYADDRKAGTEADMTEGLYYLMPAAKEIMVNTDPADFEINEPQGDRYEVRFQIVGQDFSNKVLTVHASYDPNERDDGDYNPMKIGFTGESEADRVYPQAFMFERDPSVVNGYKISYELGNEEFYLVRGRDVGSTVSWCDDQIRSSYAVDPLTFRIIALTTADGTWYLRNNETGHKVGNSNTDLYSGDQNYNLGLVPAVKPVVDVSIQKKYHYSTLILPFEVSSSQLATIADRFKVFAPENLTGDVVTIEEVSEIEANRPYIVYTPLDGADAVEQAFTNFGKGYYDDVLNDEHGLYGTFKSAGVEVDGTVAPAKYVLSAKTSNGETRVAFFCLRSKRTMPPYRCYFIPSELNSGNPVKEEAYYFTFVSKPDAIDELLPFGDVEVLGTYDATGKKLPCMQKGLNILKMADGTTRKIMVK